MRSVETALAAVGCLSLALAATAAAYWTTVGAESRRWPEQAVGCRVLAVEAAWPREREP